MERDLYTAAMTGTLIISTHTLTWSVTFIAYIIDQHKWISTHTLTWSVTAAD